MIHDSLQGKLLQMLLPLTYNIHCARFTGSPNLPSPWRLPTRSWSAPGLRRVLSSVTETWGKPSTGIEQKRKKRSMHHQGILYPNKWSSQSIRLIDHSPKTILHYLFVKKKFNSFALAPGDTAACHGQPFALLLPAPHEVEASSGRLQRQSQLRCKLATQPQNRPLVLLSAERRELEPFAIFIPHWVVEKINKITLAKHSQFLRRKALYKHKALSVVISLLQSSEPEYKSQHWPATNNWQSLGPSNF